MTLLAEIADSVADIVKAKLPWLRHTFPRTYEVAAVGSDKRIDLRPPAGPNGLGLEPKKSVEQWGLGVVTPAVGSRVGVFFLDADERTAIIVPWAFGSKPVRIELDATTEIDLGTNPTRGAARLNDTVEAGSWTFAPTVAPDLQGLQITYTPTAGPPSVVKVFGLLTVAPVTVATTGKITGASSKVKVE